MLDEFNPKIFTQPAKKPEYGKIKLNEVIKSVFSSKKIEHLYRYQTKAIELARKRKNIVVSAPTASGKSEIYINTIIERALNHEYSLVIYPTKALSRDQLKRFEMFSIYGIRAEIYDGDTPKSKKEKIRKDPPQILITNFDMLHFILLNNTLFESFFKKLRIVVVDELHIYSGVFGSHVSNIILRLKRIMKKKHFIDLQFISTSATIENAKNFANLIFKENFIEITGKGAPCGEVKHLFINPKDKSYTTVALHCAKMLEKKTIIFANSHGTVERLGLIGRQMGLNIAVYRAGLSYEKRREIEQHFKQGKIRIVSATSALELGMDIGDVDAIILAGFPGSITKVKQRIGRAGRKKQKIYSVYVARDNPLDQYYIENTAEYLYGELENCFANPENENLVKIHTLSCAKDALFSEEEVKGKEKIIDSLIEQGLLKKLGRFYIITSAGLKIVHALNIRGTGLNIKIIDADLNKQIGEREFPMAINELFEGAVYIHSAQPYISENLDIVNNTARIRKLEQDIDYYTQALYTKEADVIEKIKTREVCGFQLCFGKIHIKTITHGFLAKETFSGRKISEHSFNTPYIYEFNTYGIWIDFDKLVLKINEFGSGLHGFEHVFIAMIPAITGADSKELGGLSYSSGRLYIYDGLPEGSGAMDLVFDKFEKIVLMAKKCLKNCKCELGCPKCIFDPMCGNDNRFLNKQGARKISENFFINVGPRTGKRLRISYNVKIQPFDVRNPIL